MSAELSDSHDVRLFQCADPSPYASMRLFCMPFAGAGASVYWRWSGALPRSIEVRAIQLPGRETRLREPRVVRAELLAADTADAPGPHVIDYEWI